MFSQIKRVEIELQSKCNRHCEWCFNREYKRDDSIEMKETTFLKILHELKENNFAIAIKARITGYNFALNRFSEPMLNCDLIEKRSKQINEIFPNAKIDINTNGDFITKENMDKLKHVRRLVVSDYDNKGQEYWLKKFKDASIFVYRVRDTRLHGMHKYVDEVFCRLDWCNTVLLEDRAGYLKDDIIVRGQEMKWAGDRQERTSPCYEQKHTIIIDYNGSVMPCCHMRSDIPKYEQHIYGNVNDDLLSNILNNERALNFKERINKLDFPEVCRHCNKESLKC